MERTRRWRSGRQMKITGAGSLIWDVRHERMTAEETKIYETLHYGTPAQVRALCCPLSHCPLRVEYCETKSGARHLSVKGTTSDFIIRMSGLPNTPSWVEVLGRDFITEPSKAEPGACT